jgi:hypothetical protein
MTTTPNCERCGKHLATYLVLVTTRGTDDSAGALNLCDKCTYDAFQNDHTYLSCKRLASLN